jgi:flagellar biogenesis protein FliO
MLEVSKNTVIAKVVLGVAVATLFILSIGWLIHKIIVVTKGTEMFECSDICQILRFLILAVTILVVIVPECYGKLQLHISC